MIEIKAPHDYSAYRGKTSVFLGGSIEMGAAEDWQAQICRLLEQEDILLLNPRRENWDPGWAQSIDNPKFREQVEWELAALEAADIVFFYFSPGTKSPITLLELGLLAAQKPGRVVVCCPEGFWRKGNVDIVCARYGVAQAATLADMAGFVKKNLPRAALMRGS